MPRETRQQRDHRIAVETGAMLGRFVNEAKGAGVASTVAPTRPSFAYALDALDLAERALVRLDAEHPALAHIEAARDAVVLGQQVEYVPISADHPTPDDAPHRQE
jgi:hypothetical protein